MKKEYITPRILAVEIASCENILQSSYVDIGGNTDKFNARRRRNSHEIYDEYEDDFEDE